MWAADRRWNPLEPATYSTLPPLPSSRSKPASTNTLAACSSPAGRDARPFRDLEQPMLAVALVEQPEQRELARGVVAPRVRYRSRRPKSRGLAVGSEISVAVIVLERGYEHDGRQYRSLTQVARAITGTHQSGLKFFGLRERKGLKPRGGTR